MESFFGKCVVDFGGVAFLGIVGMRVGEQHLHGFGIAFADFVQIKFAYQHVRLKLADLLGCGALDEGIRGEAVDGIRHQYDMHSGFSRQLQCRAHAAFRLMAFAVLGVFDDGLCNVVAVLP